MELKNILPPLGGITQPAPLKNTTQSDSYVAEKSRSQVEAEKAATTSSSVTQARQAQQQKQGLDQAVAKVNELFQAEQRKLSFSVNDKTHDVVIEVRDAETDEVIRQIPPEFVVKLAEQMHEMSADESVGVLLRDQA